MATPGSPLRSIGWALALAVLVGALVATAAKRPASIWLGVAAAAFIPWLAVRTSPWLTTVNLATALGLMLASLGLPAGGSLRVPVAHHLLRIGRAIGRLPHGPGHIVHELRRIVNARVSSAAHRHLTSVLVGVVTFGATLVVLASGDALLASFLDAGRVVDDAVVRVLAALCGATAFVVSTGAVHVPGGGDAAPSSRTPPVSPTVFGLGGLSIAIGAYAATQISAAVLGADFVERRTGLTYAEYARSGFFQMVVVALVSSSAIAIARAVVRSNPEAARRLRVAAAVLTVGVIVTVTSAILKLSVYTNTFGLTMLRVYTVVFACWLGMFAVLSFATLFRASATWFAPLLLGSVCVGAFAMNVADPERIVVEHNLDRAETTGELDVGYLTSLSLDAAPTVFDRLDTIDAVYEQRTRSATSVVDARDEMERVWCAKIAAVDELDGLGWNGARHRAMSAASPYCG